MSAEKQIEEMAKDLCVLTCTCEECQNVSTPRKDKCKAKVYARRAIGKGYRKASDVALEAVDNFQSRLRNIFCTMCNDNDYNTVCLLEIDSAIECLFDAFVAELKSKYAEEENCG